MSTNAIIGFNTALKKGGTEIAEVTNISGPGLAVDSLETTSHDNANAWRTFTPGLGDAGEVTVEINYVPANATHNNTDGVVSFLTDRATASWTIEFPDTGTTTWTFTAFPTAFEPSAPVEGLLTGSLTLKLTGLPTLV